MVLAQGQAHTWGHETVGTEHLLAAMVHEGDGVAGTVLGLLGVTTASVEQCAEAHIGLHWDAPTAGHRRFTLRAKKVLELALREALQLGHNYIGTEHLLLGLIREGDGGAIRILADHSLTPVEVRQAVIRQLAGYAEEKKAGWQVYVPKHKHTLPAQKEIEGAGEGSVWSCECGTAFEYQTLWEMVLNGEIK